MHIYQAYKTFNVRFSKKTPSKRFLSSPWLASRSKTVRRRAKVAKDSPDKHNPIWMVGRGHKTRMKNGPALARTRGNPPTPTLLSSLPHPVSRPGSVPRRGRWAVAPQGRKTSLSILLTTGRQALSDRFPRRESLLTKNFSDRADLDDFFNPTTDTFEERRWWEWCW